jgi:hypothetical protein
MGLGSILRIPILGFLESAVLSLDPGLKCHHIYSTFVEWKFVRRIRNRNRNRNRNRMKMSFFIVSKRSRENILFKTHFFLVFSNLHIISQTKLPLKVLIDWRCYNGFPRVLTCLKTKITSRCFLNAYNVRFKEWPSFAFAHTTCLFPRFA